MARKMQSVLAFQPKLCRLGNVTMHRVHQTVAMGTDEEPETITMPFEGYARWFSTLLGCVVSELVVQVVRPLEPA
jgi:hypothetical protein